MIGEDGTTTVHHPIQGMNLQPYDTVDSQSPLIRNLTRLFTTCILEAHTLYQLHEHSP
jgi:hypothetical protein